jgi:phospholipid transport system substrate-binding protein
VAVPAFDFLFFFQCPDLHRDEGGMMMRAKVLLFVLFSVGVLMLSALLAGQVVAATMPDPTEQMRPFVKKVTDTLSDPELKKLSKKEQLQRLVNIARERFDFKEMSKRVLGQQWRQLDQQQQDEFEHLFTKLLQHAYVGKIDEYAGQKVEFVQQRIRDDRAEVQTLLVDKGRSIPISYVMLLRENQWMAYDVVVEGVSLIRNYMEQFKEILHREGYSGLVKQLEEKIVEIEKETIKS